MTERSNEPSEPFEPPEARRTGVRIGDPLLPATLDVLYLRPVLEALPPEWRTAVEVGAGGGDVTAELLSRGLRVLAVELNERPAGRLLRRFAPEARERRFQLQRHEPSAGASPGAAPPVAAMLKSQGFREVGFARLGAGAASGQEEAALRALLARGIDPPAVVSFRADHASADRATACVELLRAHGYHTFDLILRRDAGPCGGDPFAAERFAGPGLPAAWTACGDRPFRANVIAFHDSHAGDARRLDPIQFLCDYQVLRSRELLLTATRAEACAAAPFGLFEVSGLFGGASNPTGVHRSQAREELRSDVLAGGWARFLDVRIGRHLRPRPAREWGVQRPRLDLTGSEFGRSLLASVGEPWPGAAAGPPARPEAPSVRLTDVLCDLARLHEYADGRLPGSVVELAGGYGLAAYAYASASPRVSYSIVDYPEALAVQHYFLTLALPHVEVDLMTEAGEGPPPGRIRLVPLALAKSVRPSGELVFCSQPLHRLPAAFATAAARSQGFGACNSYFAGEWTFEGEAREGDRTGTGAIAA